jgi:hypothetical protein
MFGALPEPAVAGGERHHLGLGDHRHRVEVEGVEGLAGGQPGFRQMTSDAAVTAIGHLMLEEGRQAARRRPTLLVGLAGDVAPQRLHCWQPQLGEQQLDTRGVVPKARLRCDRGGLGHATTSSA